MFRLERILVPVDFSECSEHAFRYAVDLADRCGASVTTLYVETLHGEVRAHVRDQMDALLASVDRKVDVRAQATRGILPGPSILEVAADEDADLIVMGTHGRRGFRRMVIGSVASEVVQHAENNKTSRDHKGEREEGT